MRSTVISPKINLGPDSNFFYYQNDQNHRPLLVARQSLPVGSPLDVKSGRFMTNVTSGLPPILLLE